MMRRNGNRPYGRYLLAILLLALFLVAGCGEKKEEGAGGAQGKSSGAPSEKEAELKEFSDLSGKTVSMLTGAPFEELARSKNKDIREFTFYNNTPDMLLALEAGKTDAVLINNAIAALVVNQSEKLAHFPPSLQDGVFGIAFRKGDPARDAWQKAYDTITEEEKQALWEKWTGSDESAKVIPAQDWPGKNGTIQAAVCDTLEPMSYAGEGGKLMGFDVEMILLMAKQMDVHVEFTGMEFSAILATVQSGKATLGAGSIIVTDERRELVDFVDYYPAAFVLIVRAMQSGNAAGEEASPANGSGEGLWSSIEGSFERTFLRENRWKLFLQGIGTTLLITILSILFGTLFGFFVFMLCRNGNPVANSVTRFCIWLIRGMPVIVLLMIMYYIIFGKVSISGTAVSVVCFTLVFASGVYGSIKIGVGAIDQGQLEAAYALGYTNRQAFYRVILPQALPHFMPAYKSSITDIIKATAIVGYVAVQDLTKMGDLIRSRTLEAFFPLIAVAVIYFVLAAVLTAIVKRIEICIDPKHRSTESIRKEIEEA
ncbi:MAG: ABC transporter permease subunit [Lachnospiraceae bacterium]|nr:ABC transporter permease subunit [Lachnospiraceae bacterium]